MQGNVILVGMIEDAPIGVPITRNKLPLHITLLPWCNVPDLEQFMIELSPIADATQPISCEVGDTELFGPENNITVNVVTPNPLLNKLHDQLLVLAQQHGDVIDEMYTGTGYRAHVSHIESRSISSGTEVLIDNIALIEPIDVDTYQITDIYEL